MSIDLSSLTLTQLRYIVAVNRHRSFRVAAERCRVSQPALSMQIQKLEEILGAASAFEHGSGTTTTPTEPAPTEPTPKPPLTRTEGGDEEAAGSA